jgi:hypothetical protein
LGPIVNVTRVKSATGKGVRPVIRVHFKIRGRRMCYSFNVTNRRNLKNKILIGQNILKQGFLIDPSRK